MFGRRTFGVAGAAILGSLALLATGVAHAIVDLDAEDKSKAAVTFAKELLKASTTHGDVDYYTVTQTGSGDGVGLVMAKLGAVVAADRNAEVTFTFQNLVFLSTSTAPAITVEDADGQPVVAGQAHSGGGLSGENTVSYRLSPTAELPADTVLSLGVPDGGVGISASAPVSVTMDLTAEPAQVGGDPVTYQVSHPNAIDAKPALKVTTTPNYPVASVEDGYRKFKAGPGVSSDRLSASLGGLSISVEPYLKPDGAAVAKRDIYQPGFTDSHHSGENITTLPSSDETGYVVIQGDTSFISRAVTDTVCPSNLGSHVNYRRSDEEPRLRPQYVSSIDGDLLCVTVSGAADATPIAKTAPYVAEFTFVYKDAVNPDFVPASPVIAPPYGSIGRDGAMVRIPYLVTDERYNQRIVIVNHGAATNYEMSFTSEEGVTARAGMESSGTLPSGTTVLRTSDVVTIEGGPPHRVSGTFTIEAVADSVSVATNQTNRSNGSTDTVVYKVQDQ